MKTLDFHQDDMLLFSQSCEGNRRAFDALFCKYYKPLLAYARRFVEGNDAEEIVQNLFLWLWENGEHVDIRQSLSAYLFRTVHHRCLLLIERGAARQRAYAAYWHDENDAVGTELNRYEQEELIRLLKIALDELPATYREALISHRFGGCTYHEIAESLGVSPKTVDYRIQRAIKMLRDILVKKGAGQLIPIRKMLSYLIDSIGMC
ncbi:RNA polymerase sigma-70 factor [Prevotella sp. S7 MS 2]|uniref:RNA polymerase sigma-70 factor n=1 Tax=Prevotella sp. S7 MS 2 TaxID=1287488 RepID=UPI0005130984|nr:RNA polymerase sigma-70 factor [Prevotella sp. S7 MS 2]KGI59826.1 hypothetical protein HMPREF0671_09355 [Prevotella sp. S7 MS 2]